MAGGYQQCIYKGISVFSYTAISANNNLPKSGLSARGDRGSLHGDLYSENEQNRSGGMQYGGRGTRD